MATHRVPATTLLLGSVLDLHVQIDSERVLFIPEWRGWKMLTATNGMDVSPGRARLFLLPGRIEGQEHLEPDYDYEGEDNYERWHQREAQKVGELNAPDSISYVVGRVLRIGYRSDKWHDRGEVEDYTHDFLEGGKAPPLLYSSHANVDHARGAVIVGGDMCITEGGIA